MTINVSIYEKKYGFSDLIIGKGASHDEHGFRSAFSRTKCQISIPGFSSKNEILVFAKVVQKSEQVIELEGSDGTVCVNVEVCDVGNRRLTFYCQMLIMNLTFLPLVIHYKKKVKIPGQTGESDMIIANTSKSLRLSLNGYFSPPFKVTAVGLQNYLFINTEAVEGVRMCYQLAYRVEITWAVPNEYIYTRIVTIVPRLVLVNSLRLDLMVKQHGTDQQIIVIHPGERSPLYWTNGNLEESIHFQLRESLKAGVSDMFSPIKNWAWSQPFLLSFAGAQTILSESDHQDFLYIKVANVVDGISSIFTFEEEPESSCLYRIVNESKVFSLLYRQKDDDAFSPVLRPGDQKRFAWRYPRRDHSLEIRVLYEENEGLPPLHLCTQLISLDETQEERKIQLSFQAEIGRFVYIRSLRQGVTKCLTLSDTPQVASEMIPVLSVTDIVISRIGVSVIEHAPEFTIELFYVSLDLVKIVVIRKEKENEYRVVISALQIDNQYTDATEYPVTVKSVSEDTHVLSLIAVTTAPGEYGLYCFKSVTVDVNPLICKLESPLLQQAIEMWSRLQVTLKTYRKGRLMQLYDTQGDSSRVIPEWQQSMKIERIVYIESLLVQRVQAQVYFKHIKDSNPACRESLSWLLTAVGMIPINVDGAPVELDGLYLTDLAGSQRQIWDMLKSVYVADMKGSMLKLAGYTDILGNPLGVLNQFGKVLTGSVSLRTAVSSTMDLTVGTVSRLSGGLATGLIAVTQGKESVIHRQREKMNRRPKNVVQGMGYGARALLKGVSAAVTGVLVKPIQGARKSGLGGLLRGSLQGLSGLVIRPVAGLLDLGSNTVEGLINGTKGKSMETRQRLPRPMYGLHAKVSVQSGEGL